MPTSKSPKNSKAKIDANNRYVEKTYDRITIAIPKGKKEVIDAHAKKHGESINAYVNRAIDAQMKQEDEQD